MKIQYKSILINYVFYTCNFLKQLFTLKFSNEPFQIVKPCSEQRLPILARIRDLRAQMMNFLNHKPADLLLKNTRFRLNKIIDKIHYK